ncbi:hypothetical protein COOONC_21926 [Cooperia oncophora]
MTTRTRGRTEITEQKEGDPEVRRGELSSALETVRSYILSNDASAMPLFLELQMKLAVVSREQSKRMREERMNEEDPTPTGQNGAL